MQDKGADIIEVGIPFSDPIAEGSVIQEADLRALKGGCTTDKLFDAIKEIKDEVHIHLVFMTYINVIFRYGTEKFMKRCVECGILGVIVPDCPYEEREELAPYCDKENSKGICICGFISWSNRGKKQHYNRYRGND